MKPAFYLLFSLLVLIGGSFSGCREHSQPAPLTVTPSQALPNSTVVITGGNFINYPQFNYVEFAGGAPAVVDSATATQLFVTVPEYAVSGPIIVSTNHSDIRGVENFKVLSGVVSTFSQGTYVEHLAMDRQGNLYGDSTSNYTSNIVKFSSSGDATIFAGGPYAVGGSVDGQGTAAKFNPIWGLVADGAGNLFVNDTHTLRKITPSGFVSTLAGGSYGSLDGPGSSAQFKFMVGITIDSQGNLYICDQPRIRKVTPAGLVTTVAGFSVGNVDGTGVNSSFASPEGIAIDGLGNLYVSDTQNHNIRKISPDGLVTTFAGSKNGEAGFKDGNKDVALFNQPQAMAVDAAGNIFVSDSNYNSGYYYIRMINAFGKVTTLLGGRAGTADGPLGSARISGPDGIIFDLDGNLLFADTNNATVRKITFQ